MDKNIQQRIRENAKLVHSDEDVNQDGLPVYFKIYIGGDNYLVVDMIHKNEIGVLNDSGEYYAINTVIGELILETSMAYIKLKKEYYSLSKQIGPINPKMPNDWLIYPKIELPDTPIKPYEILCGDTK